MKEYMSTSSHAEDIGGGRMLAPGAKAELDPNDPHVEALIRAGVMAEVGDPSKMDTARKKADKAVASVKAEASKDNEGEEAS